MTLDYFVAGPRLALRSTYAMGPAGPYRLDFTVCDPDRGVVGIARTDLVGQMVTVGLTWGVPTPDEGVACEAMRLVARVLRRLAPFEIRFDPGMAFTDPGELMADGFRRLSASEWYVPPDAPRPAEAKAASIEEAYSDPYSIAWNFEPRPWPFLTHCLTDLAGFPGARVLDLGCGFGKNSILLEGLGFEIHGIDSAPLAIEVCRRWARRPELFHVAEVDSLPVEADSFEAVLDVGCLHCLSAGGLRSAVAEIARVLRPGGRLFARVFGPREPTWIDAQVYRIERVGWEPDEIAGILLPRFDVGIRGEADHNVVTAVLRG